MRRLITLFVGLFLIGQVAALGQNTVVDLSVDELYKKARTTAFENSNYDQAREYAYTALERSPDYHEIRIFIARLYSWEQNYEKAREELQYVLEHDPGNKGAFLAFIDVEKWSGNLSSALQKVEKSLSYDPTDEELQLQKGAVLHSMEKYKQAEMTYKNILVQNPDNTKAREGLESVQLKQMRYSATASYRYDYFTSIFDPWKFGEFSLSRQTQYGSIIGRVQHAQRFGSDGTQFNIDAYPGITKGLYAYISGGYSHSSIYPKYRFGLSLYKSLPGSFELAAGIRYLDFTSSQTDIYTASITKYLGSYLFTLGTYFVPSENANSRSLNMVVRRYFSTANSYISITGGYGSAPTEIQFSQDIQTLDSWSIGFNGQHPLSDRLFIGATAGYDSSEFPNFTRNRFSFKGSVTYRF